MEQRIQINIFYIVGIVSTIAGVAYLAAEYVKYLSEPGKLSCLILLAGVFGSLGKYFEDRGR